MYIADVDTGLFPIEQALFHVDMDESLANIDAVNALFTSKSCLFSPVV